MANISLEAAESPIVLAIDVGSSSVRALLFDGRARQIRDTEHQVSYSLETSADGGSVADADALLHIVTLCIDKVLRSIDGEGATVEAVATTTFWHSLLGLDDSTSPATPVLMWADTRSSADARQLEQQSSVDLHRLTGCRPHSSYWPAKLRWLHRTDPDTCDRVSRWVSLADYLALTFSGELLTSLSMASGTGLLDATTMTWNEEAMAVAGTDGDHLPELVDRDQPLPPLRDEWRERWPQLANAKWFPAVGDGATANVGAYCVGPDRIALTVGTSGAMRIIVDDATDLPVSTKLWRYRLDRHSVVVGGALSNGGNILSWLAEMSGDRDFDALTSEARAVAPDGHGLTVLPLLAGERSPSWDDRFGGTITGLRLDTTPGELFRAFMEATAYRFDAIYEGLTAVAAPDHDIYAGGGAVLRSPLWLQIIADTLGHTLFAMDPEAEASARGAAVCALQAMGAIDSIRLEPGSGMEMYTPESSRHGIYHAGRKRVERLEHALKAFLDR